VFDGRWEMTIRTSSVGQVARRRSAYRTAAERVFVNVREACRYPGAFSVQERMRVEPSTPSRPAARRPLIPSGVRLGFTDAVMLALLESARERWVRSRSLSALEPRENHVQPKCPSLPVERAP